MIIYSAVKTDFIRDVENGRIADEINSCMLEKMGRHTAANEFRAWDNSMQHMYKVMNDPDIPGNAGIAVEYNIPRTSKRVDLIISGYDGSGVPNAVIIELKQWESLEAVDGSETLVETYTGNAVRRVVHPSYQAWSYAALIRDYNAAVQEGPIILSPCVFMHNYQLKDNDPVMSSRYAPYLTDAPVFTRTGLRELREFIRSRIVSGDDKKVIYQIDSSRLSPSKSLQDSIAGMLAGNREFVMIDDQRVVYDEIVSCSEKCRTDNKKRTVIVEGGPGTGKSVIAVNLLAELTKRGQIAQYVSKNSAPRIVYRERLKGNITKSSVDNMFKGSGVYTDTPLNAADTIIADEAHRLNAKSGMFQNMGENQIREIIHSSRCSVFFIDEDQRVTMSDIGSIDEIKKQAEQENSQVIQMKLASQFRCSGSDGYPAWVDDVLETGSACGLTAKDMNYDVRIFDDPCELRAAIEEKNRENHRSRMLAGYCWDWIRDGKDKSDVYDIVIGDFKMSWNLGNSVFALDASSINEVGCIHTSQGLEFDYAGVIIGNDMRFDGNRIVTDFRQRARTDQSMKGIKKLYGSDPKEALRRADEIIKNTYRTLLTRGMKGCYIYCTDKPLSEHLNQRLGCS